MGQGQGQQANKGPGVWYTSQHMCCRNMERKQGACRVLSCEAMGWCCAVLQPLLWFRNVVVLTELAAVLYALPARSSQQQLLVSLQWAVPSRTLSK